MSLIFGLVFNIYSFIKQVLNVNVFSSLETSTQNVIGLIAFILILKPNTALRSEV